MTAISTTSAAAVRGGQVEDPYAVRRAEVRRPVRVALAGDELADDGPPAQQSGDQRLAELAAPEAASVATAA